MADDEPAGSTPGQGLEVRENELSATTSQGLAVTIVCCWYDTSFGRHRITVVADSRVSTKGADGRWTSLSDTTTKIFRVKVACHDTASQEFGAWRDPYFETEVCVAYAGYSFEAMAILSLFQRCAGELFADGAGQPRPDPSKLVQLLQEIATRWFAVYSWPVVHAVDFLVCGHSPATGEPWAAKVACKPRQAAVFESWEAPMSPASVFTIGDVGMAKAFQEAVAKLRRKVLNHADGLKLQGGDDEVFDRELEHARHQTADKKGVEELILRELESEFTATVGGVLQKAEVYVDAGNRGVVSFSRDARAHLLDGLPPVGEGLFFVPFVEHLGLRPPPPAADQDA